MQKWTTIALFAAMVACSVDVDADGDPDLGPDPVSSTCADYCDQRAACDDEVDVDACTNDCIDNAENCQADEQAQALEELDACAAESCDDIASCTIGAGLECYFGI